LSGVEVAAGVPYVVRPPHRGPRADAPVVVAYHLLDPPRTETAFAAAVPLDGLDAWKIYFGLPMSGARLPAGGRDEVWRLVMEDAVLNVHRRVTLGALAEFPDAYAAVRRKLGIDDDVPIGVMGGSMGGAVAQLVTAEGGIPARAAVLINPVVRFRATIDAVSARFGTSYQWSPESDAVAERIDFLRRADELSGTAIRFVTGTDDMPDAILDPVAQAVSELGRRGGIVDWQSVPDMAHALAAEPGMEAAPQTPHAAQVDRLAVEWFQRHLKG
jgi:pimeloyl-ACP methyl ester carboxylesterase